MAKLVEMVRNSPLVKRKGAGGYSVLGTEQSDPFVKGITFVVQCYGSAEVQDNNNTPAVQKTVAEVCEGSKKGLRKVVITVKAHCLTVTDVSTKICDSYPIFLVAYCGGHGEIEDCFFFIHKTKLDKAMRVEVFKCANEEKVKAITLTLAKAFNISYKAWMIEKKKKEREKANGNGGKGSESPAVQRKAVPKSNLTKIAPGVATGGTYTPPAPRKPPSGNPEASRTRSGSFGDKPAPSALKNPAVMRAVAHNEVTGSTHNVTLTDEFDEEFQQLAESRSSTQAGVLRNSITEDTDFFSFDNIKAHIDDDPN